MGLDRVYNDLLAIRPKETGDPRPISRAEALKEKRHASKSRIRAAVQITKEQIPENSRLRIPGAILSVEDVQEALRYLETLGPVTEKSRLLHLHIRRVGEFARRVTEKLQDSDNVNTAEFASLDPRTVEIEGLFHDIGKVAGQFGYLRTEYEGDAILKRAGMAHLIVDTVRLGKKFKTLEQLKPIEKIIMYADICGGVDSADPTRIMTYEERLRQHEQTRTLSTYTQYTGQMPAFASEIHGLLALDRRDKERYSQLYRDLDNYFHDLGIDREKIREEIMRDEASAKMT